MHQQVTADTWDPHQVGRAGLVFRVAAGSDWYTKVPFVHSLSGRSRLVNKCLGMGDNRIQIEEPIQRVPFRVASVYRRLWL